MHDRLSETRRLLSVQFHLRIYGLTKDLSMSWCPLKSQRTVYVNNKGLQETRETWICIKAELCSIAEIQSYEYRVNASFWWGNTGSFQKVVTTLMHPVTANYVQMPVQHCQALAGGHLDAVLVLVWQHAWGKKKSFEWAYLWF